jgi:CCCH-type zinc finger
MIRGQNVCVFFLLGICKFGDAKCNYSHSMAALSSVGWWTDPEEKAEMAQTMKKRGMSGSLKARVRGRRKGKPPKQPCNNVRSGRKRKEDSDSEASERAANYGFSNDEVLELLCQGVKPWDDDAHVSAVLRAC